MAGSKSPRACGICARRHYAGKYRRPARPLSERIGRAWINGNWSTRKLQPLASRAILMHGHRHIDWIGHCSGLKIVSAPSPVMEVTDEKTAGFYIHTLAIGPDGTLRLLAPEWIAVPGESPETSDSPSMLH